MTTRLSFLQRVRIAWHYAMNPGGITHKSRLSKAQAEERRRAMTEQLRREVEWRKSVDRVAYMAVSEALNAPR